MEKMDFILVDFENLKIAGIPSMGGNQRIYIFAGENQNKIDFKLVKESQKYGEMVQWVKIEGNGKNALDFHIAFYLGELVSKNKTANFFVLTGDKGFDPLIKHLNSTGISCKRITELKESLPKKPTVRPDLYSTMVEMLFSRNENSRPKKTDSLKAFFGSKGKMEGIDKDEIVNRMVKEGLIKVDNKKVVYQPQEPMDPDLPF